MRTHSLSRIIRRSRRSRRRSSSTSINRFSSTSSRSIRIRILHSGRIRGVGGCRKNITNIIIIGIISKNSRHSMCSIITIGRRIMIIRSSGSS